MNNNHYNHNFAMAFKLLIIISTLVLLDAASLPLFYQHPWLVPASAFDLQLPMQPNMLQHPINIQPYIQQPLNIQHFNIPQPLSIQPINIQPIIPEPIQPLQVQIPKFSIPKSNSKGHSPGQTILVQNSPGHQTAISSETDGVVLRSALISTSNTPGYQAALSLAKTSGSNGYGTSVSASLNSGPNNLSLAKSASKDPSLGKVEHRSVASSISTPELKINKSSV